LDPKTGTECCQSLKPNDSLFKKACQVKKKNQTKKEKEKKKKKKQGETTGTRMGDRTTALKKGKTKAYLPKGGERKRGRQSPQRDGRPTCGGVRLELRGGRVVRHWGGKGCENQRDAQADFKGGCQDKKVAGKLGKREEIAQYSSVKRKIIETWAKGGGQWK